MSAARNDIENQINELESQKGQINEKIHKLKSVLENTSGQSSSEDNAIETNQARLINENTALLQNATLNNNKCTLFACYKENPQYARGSTIIASFTAAACVMVIFACLHRSNTDLFALLMAGAVGVELTGVFIGAAQCGFRK